MFSSPSLPAIAGRIALALVLSFPLSALSQTENSRPDSQVFSEPIFFEQHQTQFTPVTWDQDDSDIPRTADEAVNLTPTHIALHLNYGDDLVVLGGMIGIKPLGQEHFTAVAILDPAQGWDCLSAFSELRPLRTSGSTLSVPVTAVTEREKFGCGGIIFEELLNPSRPIYPPVTFGEPCEEVGGSSGSFSSDSDSAGAGSGSGGEAIITDGTADGAGGGFTSCPPTEEAQIEIWKEEIERLRAGLPQSDGDDWSEDDWETADTIIGLEAACNGQDPDAAVAAFQALRGAGESEGETSPDEDSEAEATPTDADSDSTDSTQSSAEEKPGFTIRLIENADGSIDVIFGRRHNGEPFILPPWLKGPDVCLEIGHRLTADGVQPWVYVGVSIDF